MMQMFQRTHLVAVAQTAVVAFCATLLIAYSGWGFNWSTPGAVAKERAAGVAEGAQSVLVPYCTAQMLASKEATEQLKSKPQSWDRRSFVEKLATTPGGKPIDSAAAAACAEAAYEKINATTAKKS